MGKLRSSYGSDMGQLRKRGVQQDGVALRELFDANKAVAGSGYTYWATLTNRAPDTIKGYCRGKAVTEPKLFLDSLCKARAEGRLPRGDLDAVGVALGLLEPNEKAPNQTREAAKPTQEEPKQYLLDSTGPTSPPLERDGPRDKENRFYEFLTEATTEELLPLNQAFYRQRRGDALRLNGEIGIYEVLAYFHMFDYSSGPIQFLPRSLGNGFSQALGFATKLTAFLYSRLLQAKNGYPNLRLDLRFLLGPPEGDEFNPSTASFLKRYGHLAGKIGFQEAKDFMARPPKWEPSADFILHLALNGAPNGQS